MAVILCLAHYCDTHGPTPLMVTEGLPVSCDICADCLPPTDRRQSLVSQPSFDASRTSNSNANVNPIRRNGAAAAVTPTRSSTDHPLHSASAQSPFPTAAAIETPPESPRMASTQNLATTSNPNRRDSSFRKTYDENDRRRAVPCENCALTLPARVKEQIPEGAPGSPIKNGLGDNGSPVLRTRKPYEKIVNHTDTSSLRAKSTPSDSDDSESDGLDGSSRRQKASSQTTLESSSASDLAQVHAHFLDYTSTHDPLSPTSFSLLRQSCLRTLSCETLPPSSNNASVPTSPGVIPIALQTSSAPTSTSGGPIFFGDPLAGYTTAYIFRIPDPYARGRRRVYALMALSTQHERAAMRVFSFLAHAFRELAGWIQLLAEQEGERHESESIDSDNATSATGVSPGSTASPIRRAAEAGSGGSGAGSGSGGYNAYNGAFGAENRMRAEKKLHFTPTSAFLTGRTLDPDGFPRKRLAGSLRSRGLAELVGRPDFFIELHARFVAMLAQLNVAVPA